MTNPVPGLKALAAQHDQLRQVFGAFYEEASVLAMQKPQRYTPINGLSMLREPDADSFIVEFCGSALTFSLALGLTETNTPVGIVRCTTPRQDGSGRVDEVARITFDYTGGVRSLVGLDRYDEAMRLLGANPGHASSGEAIHGYEVGGLLVASCVRKAMEA